MLRLVIWLIILVASVWFGLTVLRHPGYVFVVYQPWMVQMPLWFAFVSLLFVFGLFYILITSIDRFQFLLFKIKNWFRFRREHKSYSKTQHGLAYLIEGRWKKAESLLLSGSKQSIEPLMNYLGAARAAQELGAFDRRDEYLNKAYQVAPDADLAIGLTKAELAFQHGQTELALATLVRLREKAPRHPSVLRLLEKIYVRMGDWTALQAMLPAMRKAKLLTADQLIQFEKNLYCEILRAEKYVSLTSLQTFWNSVPRYMRKNPEVVYQYVIQLLRFHANKEAQELICKTMKLEWYAPLVTIYGSLPFDNLNKQLVIVGAWLKMYGPKPEILLVLGKLCAQIQLWGKAKDYFEKCLEQGPNPAASLEYARLLDELDEHEEALVQYQNGLVQAADKAQPL